MLLRTWYKTMLKCNSGGDAAHGGAPRPYVCAICSKSFTLQGNLDKHAVTHTGEKPYRCDVCGRAFSLQGNLKKHSITHTGDKPYVCTECGKAFSQNGNLVKHMAIHRGERPFCCDICGKSFTLRGNLKKHQAIHGNVRRECRRCGCQLTLDGNTDSCECTTCASEHSTAKVICVYQPDNMMTHVTVD